jgi:magnesium transporter
LTEAPRAIDKDRVDSTLEKIREKLEAGDIQDAIEILTRLHPADLADAFTELDEQEQSALLPRLDLQSAADLMEELQDQAAADFAESLPTDLLADLLDEMQPDEAADVLGDISRQRAAQALSEMEDLDEVLPLLGHEDETAGGRMTTSFVGLLPDSTAQQAIEFLRHRDPEAETPYYLYVIDHDGQLTGVLGLRELVIAPPNATISSIMDPQVFHVDVKADQEEAARIMARYDLAGLPVVDEAGKMVGVITYDDLFDVLEEEATEDIYRLANVPSAELSLDSPIHVAIRQRLPWLFLNTFTALFASWVISNFEPVLAQVAVLAVFQSVVAALGGNAATQSLAIMVRAIALGTVELQEVWRTLVKEALTGLLQGVTIGASVGLGVFLWKGNPVLGIILGVALIGNMLIAVIVGTLIPLVLRWLNQDPALASSVLVTAVTDSFGFALFLGLAALFLPYLR